MRRTQGQMLEDLVSQVAQLVNAQAAMQAFLAREALTAASQPRDARGGLTPERQPQRRPRGGTSSAAVRRTFEDHPLA